jgi:AAA+ superfamily predicted ATPase
VNAFIRGIDRIAESQVPAVALMCTNRLSAIDPAVRRRAAEIIQFSRPNKEQAKSILTILSDVGLSDEEISRLSDIATRETENGVGFSYSDLTQRLLPEIVLTAYPERPVRFRDISQIIESMSPTPAFKNENDE